MKRSESPGTGKPPAGTQPPVTGNGGGTPPEGNNAPPLPDTGETGEGGNPETKEVGNPETEEVGKPETKEVVLRHKTQFPKYRCAGLVLTQKPETYRVTEAQLEKLRRDPWVEIRTEKK